MRVTRREFLAMGAMLALYGCGGGSSTTETTQEENKTDATKEETQVTETETLDFDGTGFEDTGDLSFTLYTSGGTTEDGNVPQILINPDTIGYGVDVEIRDGDGTICAVYIDGHERAKLNASDVQQQVLFEESDMTEGKHKVELVSASDNGATIYKSAEYEVVAG